LVENVLEQVLKENDNKDNKDDNNDHENRFAAATTNLVIGCIPGERGGGSNLMTMKTMTTTTTITKTSVVGWLSFNSFSLQS